MLGPFLSCRESQFTNTKQEDMKKKFMHTFNLTAVSGNT